MKSVCIRLRFFVWLYPNFALHKTVKETLFLYRSDRFSLYSAVCIFSQCTAGSTSALKVSHSSLKVDFGIQTSWIHSYSIKSPNKILQNTAYVDAPEYKGFVAPPE